MSWGRATGGGGGGERGAVRRGDTGPRLSKKHRRRADIKRSGSSKCVYSRGYLSAGASMSAHSPWRGSCLVGEGAVHMFLPGSAPPRLAPLAHFGGAVRVGEGTVHVLAPVHPGLVLAQRQLLNLVVQVLVAGRGILQRKGGSDGGGGLASGRPMYGLSTLYRC